MPLLEYQCNDCKSVFEKLVYTDEDRNSVLCPTCHGKKVEIQFSVFGVGKANTNSSSNSSPMSGGGSCCGGSCGCM
jgi:putative FmdB family regulatory protein